jgi:hypothetical protein
MKTTNRMHTWIRTLDDNKRRAVLAVGGLALAGGMIGGPTTAALAGDHTPSQASTSAAVATVAQAADKGNAPTTAQLMPHGTPQSGQETFTPTKEQMDNAKQIIEAGKQMKLPPRAWVIAIATSLQESKLVNLGHLGGMNDHDSLGLFQQRPSSGWGTPEQITDPIYSAKSFYKGLQNVDYQHLPLTTAAQTVQVSAYPEAYAKWEKMAADLVQGAHGTGVYADIAKH